MAVVIDRDAVEAALDEIRPALHGDGGDLILHDISNDGVVSVELLGACGTCPISIITLTAGIEVILRARVPEVAGVIPHAATGQDVLGLRSE